MIIKVKNQFAILALCVVLLLCGCNTNSTKYKRISFESESLSGQVSHIDENTIVLNNASESFSSQMPIYEIEERVITDSECKQMMNNLGLPESPYQFRHEGNSIYINLASYGDCDDRGYVEQSEDELKVLAWEAFNKIPFMEGEYEYGGIRGEQAVEGAEGKKIERVLVAFYPVLEGARVIGDNRCYLWFDGSGLVEISIRMYEYKKTRTMDIVPLTDAASRIKTPDEFVVDDAEGVASSLRVDQVKLFLVNQYGRDCVILQPMYTFYGTADFENGKQSDFKSSVIAIPESMTYVEE